MAIRRAQMEDAPDIRQLLHGQVAARHRTLTRIRRRLGEPKLLAAWLDDDVDPSYCELELHRDGSIEVARLLPPGRPTAKKLRVLKEALGDVLQRFPQLAGARVWTTGAGATLWQRFFPGATVGGNLIEWTLGDAAR